MNFTQNLDIDEHRYIFRLFLRRRYPFTLFLVMSTAVGLCAFVPASRYGFNSPQTGSILLLAAVYLLSTCYLVPKFHEMRAMRTIKRSAQFGKDIRYTVDGRGVTYTANGKDYELKWPKLDEAIETRLGVMLRFGKRTGVFVLSRSFTGDGYARFLELLTYNNIKVIERKKL